MIDTDKYEGHRQPWVFTAGVSYPMSKADIALRQDAPLLLEEVKRLRLLFRELINDMSADDYMEWCNRIGCPDGLEIEVLKEE